LGVVPRGEIQFSVSDVFVIVTMALSDPSTLEDPLANPAMTETCSFRLHYNSKLVRQHLPTDRATFDRELQ
jgi:hypothetical protein